VLVLALGTVGTPFAIAIVLYLLNSDAVSEPPSTLANAGGLGLLVVSGTLAVNFLREQVGSGIDVFSGTVLAFALLLGVATVVSGIKYVREVVLV
jgi:manganese transport protein